MAIDETIGHETPGEKNKQNNQDGLTRTHNNDTSATTTTMEEEEAD